VKVHGGSNKNRATRHTAARDTVDCRARTRAYSLFRRLTGCLGYAGRPPAV